MKENSRLTETDNCGNWVLKGVKWEDLYKGAVITQQTYEKNVRSIIQIKRLREHRSYTGADRGDGQVI